ncbi:hypothetical protein SYNPS1DRAFT_27778 [Syncephalis pseudoplumigaleata]|uniref:Protein kinase domain-containing protein n=1 Tax=Syncephalis pseudoplumigaleata TaxID=1712513 RepID=A0A4V1J1X1_9FUNG|nr:hypothetical protein SYNPS1DRAFT_27778 [Syncephalis pseudoplumigaleata]|eukprot:RKP26539.1 hypothetical protein SYNPS1DRAFT_27778 [Syncephalis pseudoplumigaleata]
MLGIVYLLAVLCCMSGVIAAQSGRRLSADNAIEVKARLPPGIRDMAGNLIEQISWDARTAYQRHILYGKESALLRCTANKDHFYNEWHAYVTLNSNKGQDKTLSLSASSHFGRILHVMPWNVDHGCIIVSHDRDATPVKQCLDKVAPADKSKYLSAIAYQLWEGLVYIHSKNIPHGSLTLDNVFTVCGATARTLRLSITNFARSYINFNVPDSEVDHTDYSPPESYVPQAVHDFRKHDSWKLGVVLFHLITDSFPFGYNHAGGRSTKWRPESRVRLMQQAYNNRMVVDMDAAMARGLVKIDNSYMRDIIFNLLVCHPQLRHLPTQMQRYMAPLRWVASN